MKCLQKNVNFHGYFSIFFGYTFFSTLLCLLVLDEQIFLKCHRLFHHFILLLAFSVSLVCFCKLQHNVRPFRSFNNSHLWLGTWVSAFIPVFRKIHIHDCFLLFSVSLLYFAVGLCFVSVFLQLFVVLFANLSGSGSIYFAFFCPLCPVISCLLSFTRFVFFSLMSSGVNLLSVATVMKLAIGTSSISITSGSQFF